MAFADDVLKLAAKHVGEKYRLGARAKFRNPDFAGPWDCAEFVSWVIFQASNEQILLGCRPANADRGDAYTGYWAEDAEAYGLVESIKTAANTKGYLLLRRPRRSQIGHIAFCVGDGKKTLEAHSRALGVVKHDVGLGTRGWDIGIRLPTPQQWSELTAMRSEAANWSFRAAETPQPDPRIPVLAAAMRKKGLSVPARADRYTDAMAKKIAGFQAEKGLVIDGVAGPQTMAALGVNWAAASAPSGTYNDKYKVYFASLVPGGFYSSDPDATGVKRSIRTNNPGALNISDWQKRLPGFVGVTPPDGSPQRNRTTIYRTPEHGVAAWFVLLADRYRFGSNGTFTIRKLAQKYAGSGATPSQVNNYIAGWGSRSNGKLKADTEVHMDNSSELMVLARAMYHFESGIASPLKDAQIKYGIETQRAGAMPT